MNWQLGLNFYSSKVLIFNPNDLDKAEVKAAIENDKYHIYLIGKRKKLFFEKSETNDSNFNVSHFYSLDEGHNKVPIKVQHSKELEILSLKDGYYKVIFNGQEAFVRDYLMANNLFGLKDDVIGDKFKTPLPSDLQIMYIGQAFGRTKERKIDYRLANHEKLQEIALKILDSASNEEIVIIGIKVEVNDLATALIIDDKGLDKANKMTIESMYDLKKRAAERISEGQKITVYEAALIKYFQPEYNKEYKETFPTPDFKSYDELFKTSFDYCAMTIDCAVIFSRLFSTAVPERKYIHHQHFPLTTIDEKKSFFEYLIDLSKSE